MSAVEMRSPASLAGDNRADGNICAAITTTSRTFEESDHTAIWIARRYRLPMRLARVVASLARIGGRLS